MNRYAVRLQPIAIAIFLVLAIAHMPMAQAVTPPQVFTELATFCANGTLPAGSQVASWTSQSHTETMFPLCGANATCAALYQQKNFVSDNQNFLVFRTQIDNKLPANYSQIDHVRALLCDSTSFDNLVGALAVENIVRIRRERPTCQYLEEWVPHPSGIGGRCVCSPGAKCNYARCNDRWITAIVMIGVFVLIVYLIWSGVLGERFFQRNPSVATRQNVLAGTMYPSEKKLP